MEINLGLSNKAAEGSAIQHTPPPRAGAIFEKLRLTDYDPLVALEADIEGHNQNFLNTVKWYRRERNRNHQKVSLVIKVLFCKTFAKPVYISLRSWKERLMKYYSRESLISQLTFIIETQFF